MRGWGKQLGSSGGWSNCLVTPRLSELRGGSGPDQRPADFPQILNGTPLEREKLE